MAETSANVGDYANRSRILEREKEYVLPDSDGLDTTAVSFGFLMPDNWMVAAKLAVLSRIAAAAETTSGIFDFITSSNNGFDRKFGRLGGGH